MLEKMQELIADQLTASQKHLLSKMIWEQILLISMN